MHPPLAQPACTLRCVAGLAWPCRRPSPAVLQAWPGCVASLARSCRSAHSRAGAQCRRPCAARRVAHRIVTQGAMSHALYVVSWRLPRSCRACRAIQPSCQTAHLSKYAHSYRDTIPQQPSPRARATRPCARVGRVVGPLDRVAGRVLGPIVAQSGRVLALPWPWLLRPACCVTIQCTVS